MRSRCLRSRFSQAWIAYKRSSILVTLGGDKICLLSPKTFSIARGSYKRASLRHCSRPGSRSPQRIASRASPSVLAIKICCVTANSCSRFATAIGCFLFSAFFTACFSTVCTTPQRPRAKNDQVLQLGQVFSPNRSSIKLFGSTNRMRDSNRFHNGKGSFLGR